MHGVPLQMTPRLVLAPSFRPTVGAALARLRGGPADMGGDGRISVTARSSLLLDGQINVERLQLDGALRIIAAPGATVTIRKLSVANTGVELHELSEAQLSDAAVPEAERLRGFRWVAAEERTIRFDEPGEHIIDEGGKSTGRFTIR